MSGKHSPINGWLFVVFWLVIFGLLMFLFARWHEMNIGGITETTVTNTEKTVLVRMDSSNSYRAQGTINGIKVNFLIDTGANSVAVPQWLAQKAGLKGVTTIPVQTAAGQTYGQMARIANISIGPIQLKNIRAIILPDDSKYVLLGMSALQQLDLQHRDGYMVLIQRASSAH